MMLQKNNPAKNDSCNYTKLCSAASVLQQRLREKPELVTTIIDAVTRYNKSFYQLQGLHEQDMEALYATAYACYVQERFEEAAAFFQTFAFYSSFDLRAWVGLAASLEQLGYCDEALLCHDIHERLNCKNSSSLFHAYDCYVVLHKISHSFRHQKIDQHLFSFYQEKKQQQQNW